MPRAAINTIPNGLTLLRLIMGGISLWLIARHRLGSAMALFTVAWALDAVDGLIARRFNQATSFGFIFDKVVDRTLLIATVIFLMRGGYVPPLAILIFVKDIASLPAMTIELMNRHQISDLGLAGKILTLLQGVAILWLVFVGTHVEVIVLPLAVAGGIVGSRYLHRVVRQ